jgi:hypothetical protein
MRSFIFALATLFLATTPGFAQFAAPGGPIPVVANLPGLNQTFWRSDVYVLNMNPTDSSFVMVLYPEIVDNEPTFETMVTDTIQISAGEQLTFTNIVQSVFGFDDAKGGLHLISLDGLPLVFSSRTYTVPDGGGSFGQNVYGTYVTNAGWITGVRHDSLYRTNVGIFVPVDPVSGLTFTVTVYSNDGTEVGSGTIAFGRAGLKQRNLSSFGVGSLFGGYIEITCSDPGELWSGYASVVDQVSGDGVHRIGVARQSDKP